MIVSHSVEVKMDEPTAWSVVLEATEDGGLFVGMRFGDKPYCTHATNLNPKDFDKLKRELGFT